MRDRGAVHPLMVAHSISDQPAFLPAQVRCGQGADDFWRNRVQRNRTRTADRRAAEGGGHDDAAGAGAIVVATGEG